MRLRSIVALLFALIVTGAVFAVEPPKERLICECLFHSYSLYIADADGKNEHPLLPGTGSSYNASFSADGRWIIFTSERSGSAEIYRVHPDGSALERLTHDPSFNDQGALSPDGKTLAFVSSREGGTANIWLLDLATGHTINLTKSSAGNFRPSWSPDGRWIAFSSDRNTRLIRYLRPAGGQAWERMQLTSIYIVRRDGTGLRRLTQLDGIAGSPKWSPDGRHLVYYEVSDVKERHEARGEGHARIVALDLRTDTVRPVSAGKVFDDSPQYLRDGEVAYLAAVQDNGIERFRLAYSSGRQSSPRAIKNPSWTPDGASVVYHRLENPQLPWAQRLPTRDSRYELIGGRPFDASQTLAFTSSGDRFFYVPGNPMTRIEEAALDDPVAQTVFDTGDPKRRIGSVSLSPDQRELAVEIGPYMERPPLPGELGFVGVDGVHFHKAIGGGDSNGFPSYSPDGSSLVYRVLGSQRGLRILSVHDGKDRVLTRGWDNFPTWSRHGDRIAFTRLKNNEFDIYTIHPDGSDLRQLTHSHGTDAHPVWSPDGRWLAFVSGRRGFKDESIFMDANQPYGEVFVMRADGSDVRQVTDNRYEELILAWLPAIPGQ